MKEGQLGSNKRIIKDENRNENKNPISKHRARPSVISVHEVLLHFIDSPHPLKASFRV